MCMENSMENDGVRLHKKVRQRFIFPFVRAETCCLIREKEADMRNSRIFTRMQTRTLTRIHQRTILFLDSVFEKFKWCVFVLLMMH